MSEAIAVADLAPAALADRSEQLRWAAARLPLAGDAQAARDCRVAIRRLREVWRAFGDQLAPDPGGQARQLRQLGSRLRPLEDAEGRLDLLAEVLGPLAVMVPDQGAAGPRGGGLRGRELEARRVLAETTASEAQRSWEAVVSRRLLREIEGCAAAGALRPDPAPGKSAEVLAREQLPRLFEAAARRHRSLAQLRRRRARVRRLWYRIEVLGPALPDQHRMVLTELERLRSLMGRLYHLTLLVEWIDLSAKRSQPGLRPALRRLVVRTELEEEVAREAVQLELGGLDAGGWWRSAELACLPERRRTRPARRR